jgi:hypothetical protein
MYWGVEQERALDKEKPQTKSHPVDVKVDVSAAATAWKPEKFGDGIRELHAKGQLCDVELAVGDEVFPAHQVMLASMSKAFRAFLQELRVSDVGVEMNSDPMAGALTIDMPPPPVPAIASPESASSNAPATESLPGNAADTAPQLQQTAAVAPPAPAPVPLPTSETPAETLAAENANASTQPSGNEPIPPVAAQRLKLRINGVSCPEAVHILLSYIYQVGTGTEWEFKPSSVDVDKDVLHLARHFHIDHLHEHAARWLITGLSTLNVVERLVICEEFQLGNLREKMMEQLAAFPDALSIVSNNAAILKHPKIMQDLLMTVATCKKQEKAPPPPEKEPEKEKILERTEKAKREEVAPERNSAEKPPTKKRKAGGA